MRNSEQLKQGFLITLLLVLLFAFTSSHAEIRSLSGSNGPVWWDTDTRELWELGVKTNVSLSQSQTYCSSLNVINFSGWSVPTYRQLEHFFNTSIAQGISPTGASVWQWSTDSYPHVPNTNYIIALKGSRVESGNVDTGTRSRGFGVRCYYKLPAYVVDGRAARSTYIKSKVSTKEIKENASVFISSYWRNVQDPIKHVRARYRLKSGGAWRIIEQTPGSGHAQSQLQYVAEIRADKAGAYEVQYQAISQDGSAETSTDWYPGEESNFTVLSDGATPPVFAGGGHDSGTYAGDTFGFKATWHEVDGDPFVFGKMQIRGVNGDVKGEWITWDMDPDHSTRAPYYLFTKRFTSNTPSSYEYRFKAGSASNRSGDDLVFGAWTPIKSFKVLGVSPPTLLKGSMSYSETELAFESTWLDEDDPLVESVELRYRRVGGSFITKVMERTSGAYGSTNFRFQIKGATQGPGVYEFQFRGRSSNGEGKHSVFSEWTPIQTNTIANPRYQLTVKKSGIQGNIVSSPTGINCGLRCSNTFEKGTVVTLELARLSQDKDVVWGGACTGTGKCTVTLNRDTVVTAHLKEKPKPTFNLSVSVSGSGKVISNPSGISCPTKCQSSFIKNQLVSLSAIANSGYDFVGWSGDCSGKTSCRVGMSSAKGVGARFKKKAVIPTNTAPREPSIGSHPVTVQRGKPTTIVVVIGTDADGDRVKVQCTATDSNYIDGSPYDSGLIKAGSTVKPSFLFKSEGNKSIYCTSFDQHGKPSRTVTRNIYVQGQATDNNQRPRVNSIAQAKAVIDIGETLSFSVSASDPDDNLKEIVAYWVDVGKSQRSAGGVITVNRRFEQAGTYTLVARAEDERGLISYPQKASVVVRTQQDSDAYHGSAPKPEDKGQTPSSQSPQTGFNSRKSVAEKNSAYALGDGKAACAGDPIDLSTGAQVESYTLLKVEGLLPVVFSLNYNSLSLGATDVGNGWDHNYGFNARLVKQASGDIKVYWSTLRYNTFLAQEDGSFASSEFACRLDRLESLGASGYRLTRRNRQVYEFDADGILRSLANEKGQKLLFSFSEENVLTKVTEPVSGIALTYQYHDNGLLESVGDPLGRTVHLRYDGSRNLVSITDAAGQEHAFTYNNYGQPVKRIVERTEQYFVNKHDSNGRVVEQDDGRIDNQLSKIIYDELSEPGSIVTKFTDRNGHTTVYTHNQQHLLTKLVNPLGDITQHEYDNNGKRVRTTDPLNQVTEFKYNADGDLIETRNPRGTRTTYTYDTARNLIEVKKADGTVLSYTYDVRNNRTSATDGEGHTWHYVYNENGQLIQSISPSDRTTHYTYSQGRLSSVTGPIGDITHYEYDAAGRRLAVTDALGATVRYKYDALDRVTQTTDPLGNHSSFSYDVRGNLLRTTDANGNTTKYEYDGNGNRVRIVDALGNVTTMSYDGEDRLTTITDARGHTTTNVYDAAGRLVSVTDAQGNTTETHYDRAGRVVQVSDAYGNPQDRFTYDANGNITSNKNALNHQVQNAYDLLDRLVKSIAPIEDRATLFSFDRNDQLTQVTYPDGHHASQAFNTEQERIRISDPNENIRQEFRDEAGRVIEESPADSGIQQYVYDDRHTVIENTNARGQATAFTYDSKARLTELRDDVGTVQYKYDPVGNVTNIKDQYGDIKRVYDVLDRVIRYTNVRGETLRYKYDQVGNLIKLIYPDDKAVNYQYDALNRLTKVIDWADRTTTYHYDKKGRLVQTNRANGTIVVRSYDAADRLVGMRDETASGQTIVRYEYLYNANGDLRQEQITPTPSLSAFPSITMSYGADNRLTAVNGISVDSDEDGNIVKLPLPNGDALSLSFDARGRLSDTGDLRYTYDAENHRIAQGSTTGETQYTVNPHASLSQVLVKRDPDGNETYYVYGHGLIGQEKAGIYTTYHFDLRGSTVALSDVKGNVLERIHYYPYGADTSDLAPSDYPFRYNGRDGVMLDSNGLHYMRARYYSSDVRRFVSKDAIRGDISSGKNLNRYAYAEGNPIQGVDPTGYFYEVRGNIGQYRLHHRPVIANNKTYYNYPEHGSCVSSRAHFSTASDLSIKDIKSEVRFCWDGGNKLTYAKCAAAFALTRVGLGTSIPKKVSKKPVRPSSFRKKTLKDSWDNAANGTKLGTKQCPTCRKDVIGNPYKGEKRNGVDGWDNDHQPKWKDRDLGGMDRKQILDEYNKNTRLRCFNCNRADN